MIHIGWDAKRAFQNTTGLGNYSRDTIRMMVECYPENNYTLYTPNQKRAINAPFYQFTQKNNLPVITAKSNLQAPFWRTKGIGKDLTREGVQIFHGLSNEIPLGLKTRNIKTVVSIHDIIFKHFPKYYKSIDRGIYHQKIKYASKHADLILTMSQCTKEDLIKYYQVAEDKIKIQYQSVHPVFHNMSNEIAKESVKIKYQLPEKFCLMVSAFEDRKNHQLVLKALAAINDPEIKIVFAGRPHHTFEKIQHLIKELHLQDQVITITNADLETLNALYDLATIFIQASLYEGFGIPVLEAMTKGLPAILSNNSSFPEIAKEAALYFDPYNIDELKKVWIQLWNDESLQKHLFGNIDIKQFNPQVLSQQLMHHYQNLLS